MLYFSRSIFLFFKRKVFDMIALLRTNRNLTQEEIASQLGITLRYYQMIEKRKSIPNVKTGLRLAKILHIDPYILFLID